MPRSGQFKKGGGRHGNARHVTSKSKTRRRSTSRALTINENIRAAAPVVKVVRVPVPAHRGTTKRTGGHHSPRHHRQTRERVEEREQEIVLRAHGAGEMVPGPFRLRSGAIAGALGYVDSGKGLTGVKEMLDKIPTVGKLPKEVLAGLALNYFADRGDWLDSGAQAFLDVGMYKLGQAGFSISGEDDEEY